MDRLDLLQREYDRVHHELSSLLDQLSDSELRCIPFDGVKSMAWLVWHITRVEDFVVNRFVAHCSQAFHQHGWGERLGVTDAAIGVGGNAAEIQAISTAN